MSWGLEQDEIEIWCNAANLFRLPYWDWANPNRIGTPDICQTENIEVIMPGGGFEIMVNPMWGFRNPKLDKFGNNVAMGHYLMGDNAIDDDAADPKNPLPVGVSPQMKVFTQCF